MADALASLFDSPPGPSRPPPPPRSPTSRTPSPSPRRARGSSEPLFLSPEPTPIKAPATRAPFDLDAGDKDESDRYAALEERYRAIEAQHAQGNGNDPGIPTAALGAYDPLAPLNGNLGEEEDGPPAKKRKPIPKIDAERLMGPYGLPALMREANRFKVKGKGHETADLKALLEVYQIWAHRMFPKGDFMGTMTRVENQLRTRRMENAMKGYREAFHPPPLPTEEENPDAQNGILSPPPEDDEDAMAAAASQTRPPVAASEQPLFDDVDLDEMAAMEEMEREAAAGAAAAGRRAASSEPPVLQEEDEWEGLYD